MQWRIQTKLRPEGPKKLFWEIAPPLPYLRVRMTGPPPLSQKCEQDECFDSAAP